MKTQNFFSGTMTTRLIMLMLSILFGVITFQTSAQSLMIDPSNSDVTINCTGFADCWDNGNPPFVTGTQNAYAFQNNVGDFDLYIRRWEFKTDAGFIRKYTRYMYDCYARINQITSSLIEFDWENKSKVDTDCWEGYNATATSGLNFTLAIYIAPSSTANIGDPVRVYYDYEIFAFGSTDHESGLNEDPMSNNNGFSINSVDQIGSTFNFNNPPGLNGYNYRIVQGYVDTLVGSTFVVKVNSFNSNTIAQPAISGPQSLQDIANANFYGKMKVSFIPIPDDPPVVSHIEFSLDIGSDTEKSDPNADQDEVFDPGDAYILGGPAIPFPGANGVRNDKNIFGSDPLPDPVDASTAAPCGQGLPLNPANYFDLDGMDNLSVSLLNYNYGQGIPSIPYFDDPLIHEARYLLISYDDDESSNYTEVLGSVPVNSFSPDKMSTYGKTNKANEVIGYDFDPFNLPASGFSLDSLWDETDIHISMSPNPDIYEADDDDVDALDFVVEQDVQSIFYFSPDHEATGKYPNSGTALNGGNVYVATALGIQTVIKGTTHLGLSHGTDIDAFEFGWIYDYDAGRTGLAMLFSVDDDDNLTPVDESGGLDPAMIYYSFLNGIHYPFSAGPLADDVDAITICNHSYNRHTVTPPSSCQTLILPQGWSGISTWLEPQPTDVEMLFNPVVSDLTILYNAGGMFWPVAGINTLGNWDVNKGYIVKMQNDATLTVTGNAPVSGTITKIAGWSVVPVLKSTGISTTALLGGLSGQVVAKEVAGTGVYWPAMGFNTLNAFEPGKAYHLYTSNDVILDFGLKAGATNQKNTKSWVASPWNKVTETPTSHLIALGNDNGVVKSGEIIGVFNSSGLCAGYSQYNGSVAVISIFADDPSTTEIDGMAEGETMTIKIYNPETKTQRIIDAAYETSLPNHDGKFRMNGLSAISLKTSVSSLNEAAEFEVYPNPASDFVFFKTCDIAGLNAQIMIYDITGRCVYSGKPEVMADNKIETSYLLPGIYQITLQTTEKQITRKLIIR